MSESRVGKAISDIALNPSSVGLTHAKILRDEIIRLRSLIVSDRKVHAGIVASIADAAPEETDAAVRAAIAIGVLDGAHKAERLANGLSRVVAAVRNETLVEAATLMRARAEAHEGSAREALRMLADDIIAGLRPVTRSPL